MIILVALTAPAVADALPQDPIVVALTEELDRSQQLTVADAPPIYHQRYHVVSLEQIDATASLGALVKVNTGPYRQLGVELRVGEPTFDNTGMGGWQNGFASTWLPIEVTPDVARIEAWRLTDRAYKQGVEQYARKIAQFTAPDDYPGDYTLRDGDIVDAGTAQLGDRDTLVELARQMSGAMSDAGKVSRAEVYVGHEAGHHLIVDTEGTRIRRPLEETSIRAVVHVHADDGMVLTDQRLWSMRHPTALPPADGMAEEARQMTASLIALSTADVLDEEYVGPVVFEGDAAADVFRYLLVPQLEGTPPEIPFDSFFGDLGSSGSSNVRLGRRVLPMGWSVFDDPAGQPDHPSAFDIDAEGTPAQPVTLVTDGIVRDVLMSRVPRRGVEGTNGHARGMPGDRMAGRASQVTVEPGKAGSTAKLIKKGLRLAASYGHDYVVVIERLQEPSVMSLDRNTSSFIIFGGDDDADQALPPPVGAKRVYADGREEPIRGMSFGGVHRWILRDIAAAGPIVSATVMASPDAGRNPASPTEGMPTLIEAPSVLIGELELVPRPGNEQDIPVLDLP